MSNLIIGASGLVGEHLRRALQKENDFVIGTHFPDSKGELLPLDICDKNAVAKLLNKHKPDVIYLPAAITNVEYCEKNPEETYKTNVAGTQNVVFEANKIGAKIVFFSSDYVFDGKNGPYSEKDLVNPISQYGLQKVLGEHIIALYSINYLILRTTVVFGWESQGKNFVRRLIDSLEKSNYVKAPTDQIGSPTYAPNLAAAVIELVEAGEKGIYNIVGSELVSRFEFAREVARVFNLDENLVQPVSTDELGQVAARPLSAGLKISKAESVLKTELLSYQKGLRQMLMDKTI